MKHNQHSSFQGIGDQFLVTKTDLKSNIVYANTGFIDICGLAEEDLIGRPHNVIRHPDMPKTIFKLLWNSITSSGEFWGYVKNKKESGGHYWVLAHVTVDYDADGKKVGYHSNRRLAGDKAIREMESLYSKLRNQEANGGIPAAEAYLQNILNEEGVTFNEYIFAI